MQTTPMFIFCYPTEQIPPDVIQNVREIKVTGSPESILTKVIDFQSSLLFEDQPADKIQGCFQQKVVAFKQDTLYGKDDPQYPLFRVILQAEYGYEMAVVYQKYKETYNCGKDVLNRKSMWSMAQDRWNWQSFEDADKVIRWLDINCKDDSHFGWDKSQYAGLPENVWCWMYDRGIFK